MKFMSLQNDARNCVVAVILQGPVSDPQWFHSMNEEVEKGLYSKLETNAQKMNPEASYY